MHFNVTHTDGLVAIAVGRHRDIGLDAENINERTTALRLARRYFTAEESRNLEALPLARQPLRFYSLWTLKESWMKATGRGVGAGIDNVSFSLDDDHQVQGLSFAAYDASDWRFWQYTPSKEHVMALAVRAPGCDRAVTVTTRESGEPGGCQVRNNAPRPNKVAKPMQSVKVVRMTPADRAGSMRMRRNSSGTMTPTAAAHSRLMSVAAAMIAAIFQVPYQTIGDAADDDRPDEAVEAADRDFFPQQPLRIDPLDLAERDAADDERHGLGAGDAAHARNDGHERGERRDLFDGPFEAADDGGRHECRDQIDAEPHEPAARRREHAREHVFLVAQTGRGHDFVRGFLADDVDHVVDGDAA